MNFVDARHYVVADGGVMVEHLTGSTWNDGGSWHKWIYKMPGGRLICVEQGSDYNDGAEVYYVVKKVVTTHTYKRV